MTYAELVIAIQDTCVNNSTQFNAHINDFIIATEDKIFNAISGPLYYKQHDVLSTVAGTEEYVMQAGTLDILGIRMQETAGAGVGANESRYLLRKDIDFLKEAYNGSYTGAGGGLPKYYSVASASTITNGLFVPITDPSLSIIFAPIPDAAYAYQVEYMGKAKADSITYLSTVDAPLTTSTWISLSNPNLLVWGSVVQAYTFMKGEQDVMAMYEKQFTEGLLLMKNLVESKQTGDTFAGQVQGNG